MPIAKPYTGKGNRLKTPETAKRGKVGGPGKPRPLSRVITDKQIADAIKQYRGMTCIMARGLGVNNSTIRRRINQSPELIELLEEEREMQVDLTELCLFRQIEAGDAGLIRFFLTTHGRRRGYVLTQSMEHTMLDGDGKAYVMPPPIINITVASPTDAKA